MSWVESSLGEKESPIGCENRVKSESRGLPGLVSEVFFLDLSGENLSQPLEG